MASLLSITVYQLFLFGLLQWKLKVNIFSVGQVKILVIIIILLLINCLSVDYVLPLWRSIISNELVADIVDACLRTGILTLFGVGAIYWWHVSEDVNSLLRKYLKFKK